MQINREPVILCLVGPAGSGKTSNILKLLADEQGRLKNSVSITTRQPRPGEVNGETRQFVSIAEFQGMIANNELFEHEFTHHNYYGTSKKTITDAFTKKYDLVFDIDIRGALNLKRNYPKNTVIVFIVPLSSKILIERIRNRGPISEGELETRLNTARAEYKMLFENINQINYFIVNDQQAVTYQSLQQILASERAKLDRIDLEEIKKICVI